MVVSGAAVLHERGAMVNVIGEVAGGWSSRWQVLSDAVEFSLSFITRFLCLRGLLVGLVY